ncbi:unnamed protein product [Candida verbasci]|uniref:Dynamin-type G domain-containing protein n=1 Tax=Candida verbasci TaxID=1227364 RepID=A0A9W4U019_9ASCO|nr:unnamed protein product [Candida verbasci]
MSEFPFPKHHLNKTNEDESEDKSDTDVETLIEDIIPKNKPSHAMYIPGENSLNAEDSSTLINGQEPITGSSRDFFNKLKHNSPRKAQNASIQQLHYNQNKISLDRCIHQTVELIMNVQSENKQRPIFYPTEIDNDQNILLNSAKAHLALIRQNSTIKNLTKEQLVKNLQTDLPEFKILKINFKMNNHEDGGNNLSNLDKKSIASLLEKKLQQQIKYLLNLKDRIDDTSSKVFVTGDLNAGKSTFCNALLRRKILPEDQQPCTSVFCEVIDASKGNNNIEEVHAVSIGNEYNIKDESTYEVFPLNELENLVYDCDKYQLLKVYLLDDRSFHESLLRNGVIDIKLIDAPGLNMDSYQTTQVFSRQEEIDLVVFVVSAENHFTLSAKEFIATAANEKRYVFIVVNKFDNIKNKIKCQERILDQIKKLSPDTYKNAKEFIHFVSSDSLVNNGDPGDPGDPDNEPNNNNNNNHQNNPDFDELEASLRKFILDKRSISKLLPAKNYLLNILQDLKTLSNLNEKIYNDTKTQKLKELNTHIGPKYNDVLSKSAKIGDTINLLIENTCIEVYNNTSIEINNTVNNLGDSPIVKYGGVQYLFEYAKETQFAMIDSILNSVIESENKAKEITTNKVSEIIKYGQNNLDDEFLNDKVFNSSLMFTRRKDDIGKQINQTIDISDFFDPSLESCLSFIGLPESIISKTINYYNPINILSEIPNSAVSLKDQIPTQLTLHTIYSSGKILTIGALGHKIYQFSHYVTPSLLKKIAIPITLTLTGFTIYYLISDIPNALPRKQARKIKSQIEKLDYSHQNSTRISSECRSVLNYPARQVMNNFQTSIDRQFNEKKEIENVIKDAEISSKFFGELKKKIKVQNDNLVQIDLERINYVD